MAVFEWKVWNFLHFRASKLCSISHQAASTQGWWTNTYQGFHFHVSLTPSLSKSVNPLPYKKLGCISNNCIEHTLQIHRASLSRKQWSSPADLLSLCRRAGHGLALCRKRSLCCAYGAILQPRRSNAREIGGWWSLLLVYCLEIVHCSCWQGEFRPCYMICKPGLRRRRGTSFEVRWSHRFLLYTDHRLHLSSCLNKTTNKTP